MNKNLIIKNTIQFIISDFDGIFTDGKLIVYSDGTSSKIIHYHDIMAIANILKKNIKFAIISGEASMAIDVLAKKFPSIETFQNERNKLNVLKSLLQKYNISPENVLYIGDDINDVECLNYVGCPATVKNAHDSVKSINNIFISKKSGGNGAFREITDLIQ